MSRITSLEKVLSNKTVVDGCWIWKGGKDKDGYGIVSVNNKSVRVTRYIMSQMGENIEKLCVCHTCDTPSCINPKHLFVSTNAGNTKDRQLKGRGIRGEDCWTSVLTEEQVIEIRKEHRKGVSRKSLKDKYNVSKSTIQFIINRRTWKHLP